MSARKTSPDGSQGLTQGSSLVSFARNELALELTPAQAEMMSSFEAGKYSTAVWQCGRRGGKSLMSDVIALYDVALRGHLRKMMRPGEPRIAAIIAPRLDQAEAHIRNCALLAENSPLLRQQVVNQTSDALTFKNGSQIRAFPCSARSIRGGAWSCAVLDELGHFLTSEEGNAAGDRILEAVTPALAQFGHEGWMLAISTPLWRAGAFWKLVERAQSGRFEHMHHRHKSTAEMNPAIPADWLEERRREDPDMFSREFEANFVDGVSAYFTSTDVLACVRPEPLIRRYDPRYRYEGTLDPAYTHDNFALSVGHRDEQGSAIVDGVWVWRQQGHESTLDQVKAIAQQYCITQLRTDQFAAEPIREALAKRGIHADYQPWTNQSKSDAFASLKVALNTRIVELPNDSGLIEELCQIEARPTPGGFTKIAAAGSAHDDRAVAVAALVHGLTKSEAFLGFIADGPIPDPDWEELKWMGSARSFFRVRKTYADGTTSVD